ncbi:MAG: single-stranded-DNA-specific exonuclease RecJ [Patescibacteria group bacterium]
MNLKLLDYLKRYEFQTNKYSTFFTSLERDNLPDLIEVEFFNIRLSKALNNNEKICIYSDYDADAITATATMYWGLILLGFNPANISFYAPDRFTEGYGINLEAIQKLSKSNQLIISVDCGINSTIEANWILDSKCDLIITDHHVLSGSVPQAQAVINPRLTEEYQKNYLLRRMRESNFEKNFSDQEFKLTIKNDYVSPSVCGVGVAWFCLLHLAHHLNKNPNILNLLLPFVAIGTIADCQSIRDNQNRLLVKAGLKLFPQAMEKFVGLKNLVKYAKLNEKIELGVLSSQDLGYVLAPILNAAGRIDHASLAIKLLCSLNEKESDELSQKIIQINTERKSMVLIASQSVMTKIDSNSKFNFLVTDYSKGIVGLIASKLLEKNNKVSIVISQDPKGYSTASIRAPKGYNVVEIMKQFKQGVLIKYGGHPEAAGFSCENERCDLVKEEFERVMENYIVSNQEEVEYLPAIQELEPYNKKNYIFLETDELDENIFNDLNSLEPFGQDFQMPKFVTKLIQYDISYFGSLQNHLRIKFRGLQFIRFNISEKEKEIIQTYQPIYLSFSSSKNIYNYIISNQLIIDEIILQTTKTQKNTVN